MVSITRVPKPKPPDKVAAQPPADIKPAVMPAASRNGAPPPLLRLGAGQPGLPPMPRLKLGGVRPGRLILPALYSCV